MGFDTNLNFIQNLSKKNAGEALVYDSTKDKIGTTNEYTQKPADLKAVIIKVRKMIGAANPFILGSTGYDLDRVLNYLENKKETALDKRREVMDVSRDSGLDEEIRALAAVIKKVKPLVANYTPIKNKTNDTNGG